MCLFRGELGPHLIPCGLGQDLPPYQVASSSIQPFGHNTWAENWGLRCHFVGRGAGPPSNIVAWVEAYLRTKWHLNPSSRSATTEMGRKLGRLLSSFLGGDVTGSNRHNVAWSEAYLRTKWHLDPSSRLATTDMGQKLGGGCAPF